MTRRCAASWPARKAARWSAKLLPLSANASTVVRKGMLRDGVLCPAATIRASIDSRPNRWISVSAALLSLTEIIQLARLWSVTGVSLGQLAVPADEKLRSEERRVGKEGVSTCRYRWAPYH